MGTSQDTETSTYRKSLEFLKDLRALRWAVGMGVGGIVALLFLPMWLATFFIGSFVTFFFVGLFVWFSLSNARPVESIASFMREELIAGQQAFVGKSEELVAKADDFVRIAAEERAPSPSIVELKLEFEETMNTLRGMVATMETAAAPPYRKDDPGTVVRLVEAKPEFTSRKEITYKSKVRCEFQNVSGRSIKVKTSRWASGMNKSLGWMVSSTLQIRIEGRWLPNGYPKGSPDGASELHVPPYEFFRTWIGLEDGQVTERKVREYLKAGALGTLELLIDGRPVEIRF